MIKCDGLLLVSVFNDRQQLLQARGLKITDIDNISVGKLGRNFIQIPVTFIHGVKDTSIPIAEVFLSSTDGASF